MFLDIKRASAISLLLKPLDKKSKISISRFVIWLLISSDMFVTFDVVHCFFVYKFRNVPYILQIYSLKTTCQRIKTIIFGR